MTKVLGTIVVLFGMFVSTGCPEGDDDADAACPLPCATGYVCLYGECVPEGSDADGGADADDNGADGDTDAAEVADDATTDETASCPGCPVVAGDWNLTRRSDATGAEWTTTLHLYQDDGSDIVTGDDEDCDYTSGNITEGGILTLTGDCPPQVEIVNADLSGTHLDGNFRIQETGTTGTWRADRQ